MFKRSLAFLIIILCTAGPSHAGAAKIRYMIEQNPPYNFVKDNAIQGIAVDLLIELTKKSSQPVSTDDIVMIPWARGYQTVLTTPGTCLFSMGRTEQRKEQFKWVGPIIELTIGLTASKKKHITIDSIEDLTPYRIGTIRDGAPEQLLLQAGYPADKLERVTKPQQNIQKLVRDRLDLIAFNTTSTYHTMLQSGLDPDDYETVFILKKIELYYAFNRETDDARIEELDHALKELKKTDADGKSPYESIISSYLNAESK